MPGDALATLGARASRGIVFTPKPGMFLSPAPEDLRTAKYTFETLKNNIACTVLEIGTKFYAVIYIIHLIVFKSVSNNKQFTL